MIYLKLEIIFFYANQNRRKDIFDNRIGRVIFDEFSNEKTFLKQQFVVQSLCKVCFSTQRQRAALLNLMDVNQKYSKSVTSKRY